jgi:hypothetical protein
VCHYHYEGDGTRTHSSRPDKPVFYQLNYTFEYVLAKASLSCAWQGVPTTRHQCITTTSKYLILGSCNLPCMSQAGARLMLKGHTYRLHPRATHVAGQAQAKLVLARGSKFPLLHQAETARRSYKHSYKYTNRLQVVGLEPTSQRRWI